MNEKNINEIFTGICKVKNHSSKLQYFCKTHNKLCCVACISIIKANGNGFHQNCKVCLIEDIREEKKNLLQKNIEYLEQISSNIKKVIGELKVLYESIEKNKKETKLKVQKFFTEIRNIINTREDQLLKEIDNEYYRNFFRKIFLKQAKN